MNEELNLIEEPQPAPRIGYTIVRIRLDPQSNPLGFEDFVSGWLTENGRHTGTTLGSLLVTQGVKRHSSTTIAYTGAQTPPATNERNGPQRAAHQASQPA